MYIQALVLAAFAIEGALGQPAHHNRHVHKRHLDLQPRQDFCDIENYKNEPWYAEKKAAGTPLMGCPPAGGNQAASSQPEVENKAVKQGSEQKQSSTSSSPASQSSGASSGGDESKEESAPSTGDFSDLSDAYTSADTTGGNGPTAASQSCLKNAKRATAAQVNFAGNTGGSCYGSNLTPAKDGKISGEYGLTIKNGGSSDEKFWVWNKGGPSDGISGMMNHAFWQFTLKSGQSAAFDVAAKSIVGFSKAIGRASDFGGVPKGTIGEVTYHCEAQGCTGGSYYDVSQVIYNQMKAKGANPTMVDMSITSGDWSESTTTKCSFEREEQDHPDDSSCQMGPPSYDGKPYHVTAVIN